MPPRDRDHAGSGAEAPFLAWRGVEAQGPGDRRGRAGEAAWGAQGQLGPCGHGRQAGWSGLLQAEAPKPGDPARESPVLRPDLRVAAQGRAGRHARQRVPACSRRGAPSAPLRRCWGAGVLPARTRAGGLGRRTVGLRRHRTHSRGSVQKDERTSVWPRISGVLTGGGTFTGAHILVGASSRAPRLLRSVRPSTPQSSAPAAQGSPVPFLLAPFFLLGPPA